MKNKSLMNNIAWNMIGVTLNSIYSIIIIFFITRFSTNGIVLSGKFSFAFYITALFSTIGNYGGRILQLSNKDTSFKDEDYISLKYISNIIMVVFLIFFIILNNYELDKILLLLVLILYRVVESIADSYYGVMQKNDHLDCVGKSMSLKAILSIILFVLIMIKYNNIVLASFSFFVSFILVFIFYDKKICKKFISNSIVISKKTISLLKISFSIFLFSFFSLLNINIVRYFVDLNLSDYDQGIYNILVLPSSLISLFAQFLLQPFINDFVDDFNSKNIKSFEKRSNIIIISLIIIGFVFALFMFALGTFILSLIYNVDLSNYCFVSSLLIIGGIFNACIIVISNLLTITKNVKIQYFLYTVPLIITSFISYNFILKLNDAFYIFLLLMVMEFVLFYITLKFMIRRELHNEE